MRRRQPETPATAIANAVPAELAAGACMEVWVADDERAPSWWEREEINWRAIAAFRRFSDAR